MEDAKTIERGDSLPLQLSPRLINSKWNAAFNKRLNEKISYSMVSNDNNEVKTIPGTNPPRAIHVAQI